MYNIYNKRFKLQLRLPLYLLSSSKAICFHEWACQSCTACTSIITVGEQTRQLTAVHLLRSCAALNKLQRHNQNNNNLHTSRTSPLCIVHLKLRMNWNNLQAPHWNVCNCPYIEIAIHSLTWQSESILTSKG